MPFLPPALLPSGSTDVVVHETDNHTGPVRCLDINPFQPNLLVSGASESEIYIWDLSNPSTPMSPGNRTQVCVHVCA